MKVGEGLEHLADGREAALAADHHDRVEVVDLDGEAGVHLRVDHEAGCVERVAEDPVRRRGSVGNYRLRGAPDPDVRRGART